ncbi:hypothetical protein [Paraburkholderia sp. J10-1]|uniref:hypothetical protein n=1 Tax=Paraburkholderia sp. J10-1 TaxID=2805430 RepID=UPI002AB6DD8F|nr:hypothetical protein [Paraburkholderia sp. J10-1]
MTVPIFLHGLLATHRRGRILQEVLSATPNAELPDGRAVVLAFGEVFQSAEEAEQIRLIEWTRVPGRVLLLLPPFAGGGCEQPVSWEAERVESAPRGGEGLAKVLAHEVGYRLVGKLQTPALPGATWSDLSVSVGSYRLHPAAGLFAVTCLPLWSLAVLDAPEELERWLASLVSLAGEGQPAKMAAATALSPDHYGFLVFLLSQTFADEEQAIAGLRSSSVFRFSLERGRSLLKELSDRGLVDGAMPTSVAYELVMQSPYAPYVGALREVSNR